MGPIAGVESDSTGKVSTVESSPPKKRAKINETKEEEGPKRRSKRLLPEVKPN